MPPTDRAPDTAPRAGRRSPSGWLVGRIAGAPVYLAPSWLFIAALLTWVFLPPVRSAAPGLGTVATAAAAAAFPVLLALSVLLHEIGHGLTARRLGVPVTEYVITLWGGHTQFDREIHTPGASAAISVAGPAVNGVLALLSWWAASTAAGLPALLLGASAFANGFVAGFNLLPGLPLDGGRVLEAAIWKATGSRVRGAIAAAWAGRVIAVAFALVALGRPLLTGGRASIVTALTVVLVSGFIWAGASQALRQARTARAAGGVDLLALARPAVTAAEDAQLAAVEHALGRGLVVVLVAADGTPSAIVDPDAAASVPPAVREVTSVRAVATPVAPESVVGERFGLAAVRAMGVAQHAGRAAVLVDRGASPPGVLGVVLVSDVADALGPYGRRGR